MPRGRAVSLWGTAAAYDALGREAAVGSETVLYAPNGVKLGLMSGSTVEDIEIPLPGGSAAVYNASGLELYRSADWLGSAALTTVPGGGLASTDHYTPFGFDVTGAGAQYRGFSGQHQWTDTSHTGGQYDFMYREYNSEQGRWWTPDPAGLAAVDPGNPQSWNEYAYVDNQPLSVVDPLGLDPCEHWIGRDGRVNDTCNPVRGGPSGPGGGDGCGPATFFTGGTIFADDDGCGGGGGGSGGGGGAIGTPSPLPPAPPTTAGPHGPVCVSPASIDALLANTPLAGEGQDFYNAGQKYGVNPAVAVAIAGAESSFGAHTNATWGFYNAWGWGNTPALHAIARNWSNWTEGINKITWQLGGRLYLGAGLDTMAQIYSRWCTAGDCAGGLRTIDAVLDDFGVDPSSLRFQACAKGGQ